MESAGEAAVNALGNDLFVFLAASVFVVPLSRYLNITPVLGFIALGACIGPYGLGLFSNTEADVELGDFGILFLLFVEGLNLSPERIKKLGSFFSLGSVQILFSMGVIFFSTLWLGPLLLPLAEQFVPIDDALVRPLLERPVEAFTIAAAGALSSSAFVLPVLKQKGWEQTPDGTAALSILLLQDLAVAPLLVILPIAAGSGPQSGSELGLLVAKATFGFGGVLFLGGILLRRVFELVALSRSTETFVAAALLVAVGMGSAAEQLGLSSTTGAFAAGVLLAGSRYRAQIEADIKPFEGILLGVFFMTAGATLDPGLCVQEWPTLLTGILAFLGAKALVLLVAGELALGLSRADAVRVAFLLAGGGEFAFVVFKLAQELGVLPETLAKLLTASVIISMSLTPLLGELAGWAGEELTRLEAEGKLPAARGIDLAFGGVRGSDSSTKGSKPSAGALISGTSDPADAFDPTKTAQERVRAAFDLFDLDGSGAISCDELKSFLTKPGDGRQLNDEEVRAIIAEYDTNGDGLLQFEEFAALWTLKQQRSPSTTGGGDAAPRTPSDAIVVCGYGEIGLRVCEALNSLPDPPAYIAIDRNPKRISAGVMNDAPVVYGDGASVKLLKAAGITKPRAFLITFASAARCLETTTRLREAFPETAIYARTVRQQEADELMAAGATAVVVETTESAVRFAKLLGLEDASKDVAALMRRVPSLGGDAGQTQWSAPYSQAELMDLADETGVSLERVLELYELFADLASTSGVNDEGEVPKSAVRDLLILTDDAPMDDETLEGFMPLNSAAEGEFVGFFDFVRMSVGMSSTADSVSLTNRG